MTDTNPSGAPTAPAADTSAPAAGAETPAGNFGSTRGSGLARGKRPSSAAAQTATPVKSDYKPTSLEIIMPVREYKNPFSSPEPENAPVQEPARVEEAAAAPSPVVPSATAESVPVPSVEAFQPEPERQQINILPPAEAVRPAVRWESSAGVEAGEPPQSERPQRDERPTFRPDRREDAHGSAPRAGSSEPRLDGRDPRRSSFQRDGRQPRDPRDARQPRDPREAREPRQPRDPRDERPQFERRVPERPAEQAPAKPTGFLGWLKGLFGGAKAPEAPATSEPVPGPFNDGHRPRRRHRGGRGHGGGGQGGPGGGNPQGFRGERPAGGGEHEGHGGHRRRRHRGGSGRDRGGNPRSEGHQGGGAI